MYKQPPTFYNKFENQKNMNIYLWRNIFLPQKCFENQESKVNVISV